VIPITDCADGHASIRLYGYANIAMVIAMTKVEVFDPAMCCSTGVCGPNVDPLLPRFAADLDWLKSKGVQVERYNLAQEVAAFVGNPIVKAMLNSQGTKCLPLILVNGKIVSQSGYPSRKALANLVAVDYQPEPQLEETKCQSSLVSIGGASIKGKQ